MPGPFDSAILVLDRALRVLGNTLPAARPMPEPVRVQSHGTTEIVEVDEGLSEAERRHAAGLMRVNHVGEVCAQALYDAQAGATANDQLRKDFSRAAAEETDHLAWTATRLNELGSRPSLLNPLWYAGAYAMGSLAGRLGDRVSLGFVVETERQVEEHLNGHLNGSSNALPMHDLKSRSVVEQMAIDEHEHGKRARGQGAMPLPLPVRLAMRAAARVMTATAYWI